MTATGDAVVAREAERAALWRLLETAAAMLSTLGLVTFVTGSLRVVAAAGFSDRSSAMVLLASVAHPLSLVLALIGVLLCVLLRVFAPTVPVSGRVRLASFVATVSAIVVGAAGVVLAVNVLGGAAGDDPATVAALSLQGIAALATASVTVWLTTMLRWPAVEPDDVGGEVPSP